jgi:hypothetical protein
MYAKAALVSDAPYMMVLGGERKVALHVAMAVRSDLHDLAAIDHGEREPLHLLACHELRHDRVDGAESASGCSTLRSPQAASATRARSRTREHGNGKVDIRFHPWPRSIP